VVATVACAVIIPVSLGVIIRSVRQTRLMERECRDLLREFDRQGALIVRSRGLSGRWRSSIHKSRVHDRHPGTAGQEGTTAPFK
jgi:hypothetical protein